MARLSLEQVTVEIPMLHARRGLLRRFAPSAIGGAMRFDRGGTMVRALDDVTLDLSPGDRLAVTGPNGAGKTTLLRTMAGIYMPCHGRVQRTGQLTPLLSVGMGLDLDASGLDNIELLGLHLDIPPHRMRRRTEEIVEWTGLGPFIGAPMRSYSAGMVMRLVFAVSTCEPPEILLLDEWLGIGDAEFQVRAYERMSGFVGGAAILVLASHAPDMLRRWCNRAIRLEAGQVAAEGAVADMVADPSLMDKAAPSPQRE